MNIEDQYIGQKRIKAAPMTRAEYDIYRGWELPADEDGSDEGYLVEYVDGGQSNHKDHEGYISWSPKAVFERAYKRVDAMTFGEALEALKRGSKVARAGWNGKGMWLVFVPGTDVPELRPESPYAKAGLQSVTINAHIDMMTATGEMQPGWLASQADLLADDWAVVE